MKQAITIIKYTILGISLIICMCIFSKAVTYKYKVQDSIIVTGLGETEFSSDLIVWSGCITTEATDRMLGYSQIQKSKAKVENYIVQKGIDPKSISFQFVNIEKDHQAIYNAQGNYMGQRFSGYYNLRQEFVIESDKVEIVESISREISSLIAEGVNIEAYTPAYFYTKLDDVKLELIEKASADAFTRASRIAKNANTKIGKATNARMGVFQITSANGNEEFSSGGTFNTTSRNKKARITVRVEYRIK